MNMLLISYRASLVEMSENDLLGKKNVLIVAANKCSLRQRTIIGG